MPQFNQDSRAHSLPRGNSCSRFTFIKLSSAWFSLGGNQDTNFLVSSPCPPPHWPQNPDHLSTSPKHLELFSRSANRLDLGGPETGKLTEFRLHAGIDDPEHVICGLVIFLVRRRGLGRTLRASLAQFGKYFALKAQSQCIALGIHLSPQSVHGLRVSVGCA